MTSSNKSHNKFSQSFKSGHHATVYEVRRDPELKNKDVIKDKTKKVFPFVSGSQYKGQWFDDQKQGFGIQVNPDNTKYEGEWFGGNYEGRGTLWIKKNKSYIRQYVGDWSNGSKDGQGIYYYDNGEIYKGEWKNNKKSGNGRHDYCNGDSYTGDWLDNLRDGFGTMNYANGNIFEGLWVKGNKEGPGLYFYASTKKIYQGEWYEDQPRCGEFRAPHIEEEIRLVRTLTKGVFHNEFSLPSLGLTNPKGILDSAVSDIRMSSISKSFGHNNGGNGGDNEVDSFIDPIAMESAKARFYELTCTEEDMDIISIYKSRPVFNELGLNLEEGDVNDIIEQLELKDTLDISFAELVEIAVYIHEEKMNAGINF